MNIFSFFSSKGHNDVLEGLVPPHFSGGGGAGKETEHIQQKEQERRLKAASASEDQELVKKVQAGDTRAFDALVLKHRNKIYAMVHSMVNNEADAWDVSQEVFVKAWRALPRFEERAQFSTWLYRIAQNASKDWLRKQKRKKGREDELNDEVFNSSRIESSAAVTSLYAEQPDKAIQRSELRRQIDLAVEQLSPNHREVYMLREIQGYSYKKIAEITEVKMGTVMSRISEARKKLRELLSHLSL